FGQQDAGPAHGTDEQQFRRSPGELAGDDISRDDQGEQLDDEQQVGATLGEFPHVHRGAGDQDQSLTDRQQADRQDQQRPHNQGPRPVHDFHLFVSDQPSQDHGASPSVNSRNRSSSDCSSRRMAYTRTPASINRRFSSAVSSRRSLISKPPGHSFHSRFKPS